MEKVALYAALVLTGLSTSPAARAQDGNGSEMQAGVTFIWAVPQDDFGDHVEPGVGFTAFLGGYSPAIPLVLATEIGLVHQGSEARLEVGRIISGQTNLPIEAIAVESSSNMGMAHLLARLQPPSGVIRPYLDALLGVRYLYTKTRIRGGLIADLDNDWRDGLDLTSTQDGFALSYGVGGGINLRVARFSTGWRGQEAVLSLNAGARYLFGTKAEYVEPTSLQEVNGEILLETVKTRTDLLLPHFGFMVGY
jgi:hypothetical protein